MSRDVPRILNLGLGPPYPNPSAPHISGGLFAAANEVTPTSALSLSLTLIE
jgi:hypothetical protein